MTNAVVSYVRYITKTLWPADLAIMVPHPALPWGTPLSPWLVVAAAALLLIATFLTLRAR
jgi:hypothetical protein